MSKIFKILSVLVLSVLATQAVASARGGGRGGKGTGRGTPSPTVVMADSKVGDPIPKQHTMHATGYVGAVVDMGSDFPTPAGMVPLAVQPTPKEAVLSGQITTLQKEVASLRRQLQDAKRKAEPVPAPAPPPPLPDSPPVVNVDAFTQTGADLEGPFSAIESAAGAGFGFAPPIPADVDASTQTGDDLEPLPAKEDDYVAGAGFASPPPVTVASIPPRNFTTEQALYLGYQQLLAASSPETIMPLAETILGKNVPGIIEERTQLAASYTLPPHIHVIPHQGSGGDLNEFNSYVLSATLSDGGAKQSDEFNFIKIALARIIAAHLEEVLIAQSPDVAMPLATNQTALTQSKKLLEGTLFHLHVVRNYVDTVKAEEEHTRVRLYEMLHALYDFERVGSLLTRGLAHWGSQSRYTEKLGKPAEHMPFDVDSADIEAKPQFASALQQLLYDADLPQLDIAVKTGRISCKDPTAAVTAVDDEDE